MDEEKKWHDLEIPSNHWSQTEEGKNHLLKLINQRCSFDREGNVFCRECKNESIACVCMNEDKI